MLMQIPLSASHCTMKFARKVNLNSDEKLYCICIPFLYLVYIPGSNMHNKTEP